MYNFNFSLVNLGCTKNLVDSQFIIWKFLSYWRQNENYSVNYSPNPYEKDVEFVFLNTCWFLSSWRNEMIDKIKKLISKNKKVYVTWCALKYFKDSKLWESELWDEEELKEFNEIIKDPNVFQVSWPDLENLSIWDIINGYDSIKFWDFEYFWKSSQRAFTNIDYSFEYLKIAEWCNNTCSFCIIPKIRGKQKSIDIKKLVSQTEDMLKLWAQEIILTSQDTTRYWIDLYKKPALFDLLEELENLPYDFMYRLLYLYPDIVSLKHLEKLSSFEKFVPYFDIPLQHISSNVLKRMWRFYDQDYIYKFLEFIKESFPTKFVRTNFIVWFPWETEEDFKELCEFASKWYFDNIAIFQYHDEPLAWSSKLDWKISDEVMNERFNILKSIVNDSIDNKNENRKWKEHVWFVHDIYELDWDMQFLVRDALHAPEIDPYDEISIENITWVYNDTWEVQLGTKILYNL